MSSSSPKEGNALLEVGRFSVAQKGTPLLRDVAFHVGTGELVALTGPSGCGKTTLLRAIAGLTNAHDGVVTLNGLSPETIGWPQYRRQAPLVEQRPVLLESTVLDNLRRPFQYRVATSAFSESRARALLEQANIGPERLNQNAKTLSEGQQQRVCLIRALLLDPVVVLLDEPTSALDEVASGAVETLVRGLVADKSMGALVVTHDKRQAARWCDRVIDLDSHMVH